MKTPEYGRDFCGTFLAVSAVVGLGVAGLAGLTALLAKRL